MKRKMVLIVLFVIIIAACGNGDYKYANAVKAGTTDVPVNTVIEAKLRLNNSVRAHADEIQFDLSQQKGAIEACLGKYSSLDWSQFAGIQTVMWMGADGVVDDFFYHPTAENVILFRLCLEAIAVNIEDAIVFLPGFEDRDEDERFCIVVHELIHSLVPGMAKVPLEEGLVDYLTKKVAKSLGISYTPPYMCGYLAMTWLVAIFGEEEAIDAVVANRLCAAIGALTKDGMGECLAYSVERLDTQSSSSRTSMANAMLDVLVHLAQSTGKEPDVSILLMVSAEMFRAIGIKVDSNYLESYLLEPVSAGHTGGAKRRGPAFLHVFLLLVGRRRLMIRYAAILMGFVA